MSIRTECPSCGKVYNLADSMQGKTVRCAACQSPFGISTPARKAGRDESRRASDDRIATSSRSASAARRTRRDEEEDEEPRWQPGERRSRRGARESRRNNNLTPTLIGAGVAALVAIVLIIVGVVLLATGRRGKSDQAAVAADATAPAPVPQKVVPTPLAANEPPAPPARKQVAPPPVVPSAGTVKTDEPAVPSGPLPAEMAPEVVKKVKRSTAYLRVTMPDGKVAQGSGFFALESGILITNAHVVGLMQSNSMPQGVEVVVNSGETGETKMTGTIVGVDRDNDLAVLRVAGDLSRMPPPLPVAGGNELTETQTVYIFGFPFGASLGKNITVSRSSISSLRTGKDGVLKQVQVNGGMTRGNSGGPVTDTRGAVVGVSVAGITGTQINFAVPADFIRPLVQRSKTTPLDLSKLPPPVASRDDAPTGPTPIRIPIPTRDLTGDLAAMRGTWESTEVKADGGKASGNLKLSISPSSTGVRGRVQIEIATKQGGTTTSSRPPTYNFMLTQEGVVRYLITNVNRQKGMVFVYYFKDDQLVLSGTVVSSGLSYTLLNVTFRRTSAEPEIAGAKPAGSKSPAAGAEKGKGSPAGLKFRGDVFSFIAEAVRDKRLTDVDIRGFTLGKDTFRDICEEGGVLIGFQIGLGKSGNNDVLKSWQPIYLTKNGEKFGKWQGPASAAPITLKAKPGYVVSGVSVRSGRVINALTLTFAKLGKDSLDLSDTYKSEQVGGDGGIASSIGGTGALFAGVTGHLGRDRVPSSLGLVAVLPK